MKVKLSRRQFSMLLSGAAMSAVLTGCGARSAKVAEGPKVNTPDPAELRYASFTDSGYTVPSIPANRLDRKYWRQVVDDPFGEVPGTIVVDTPNRFLYLTLDNGQAMRYGIGVGKAGFTWSGRAKIQFKRPWPTWTPPKEMIEREPELAKWADGQPPGLDNPLGARALYIFQNGRDTLYRIHGSPEWWTIGTAASSGCIRLTNHDIVDLYDRVPKGAPIVVIPDNRIQIDTVA
ncbi:L,D-transpeptidase [Maritalea mediterranea]|uniref:L,D-transpeptidase n=1 Tax=Maritalea mediterranea TaxID=2909667 RepID=UPI003F6FCF00